MNPNRPACPTCGKTAERLKHLAAGGMWECSHIECPNRRHEPVLDHAVTQEYQGGYRDKPANPATGCWRITPTTRD